jgi:hypothetical protein
MNLDLNMDVMNVRKWSWTGFGKPVSKVPHEARKAEDDKAQDSLVNNQEVGGAKHYLDASGDVDTDSLAEAIDSNDIRDSVPPTPPEDMSVAEDGIAPDVSDSTTSPDSPDVNVEPTFTNREDLESPDVLSSSSVTITDNEPVDFSSITVHLSGKDPLVTYRRRVFYATVR